MMRTTRKDIVDGVTAYVERKYAGDWKLAFDREDDDGDGLLSVAEVMAILAKSDIGYKLFRWGVALEVVRAIDADDDGKVSFEEFQAMTGVE